MKRTTFLALLAALLVLFAAAAPPALAVSFDMTVTGLNPTQLWGGYPPLRVADVSLYAPDTLYGATATITGNYVPGDTLASTACGSLSCVYTAPTLTISGAGSAAQYTSALSAVVFSTTATGDGASGDRTVTYSIDVTVMPGYFKCPGIENHYYYHFNGGYRTWSQARGEALNYKYLGYTGYLVHLNSQAENDCVYAQYNASGSHQGWIGLRGVTPTGPYNWVDGPTADNPSAYTNWASGEPADKPSQQYVYMDGSGDGNPGMWSNVLDNDSGSKDGYVVEFGNPTQDSGQPKSGTAIVHVIPPPDLTATMTASGAKTVPADSWTWRISMSNSKEGAAVFHDGDTILQDDLPDANISYGTPSILNVTNVTNANKISCSIATSTLTCVALGDSVTIGGFTGKFAVQFSATASDAGTFANPRAGGICKVDPNDVVIEWDGTTPGQNDNDCGHTVYVSILQRDRNGYSGVQDTTISVHSGTRLPAGASTELDIRGRDTAAALISFDLTGQLPSGVVVQSAAQWVYAYKRCNNTYWSLPWGTFLCMGNSENAPLGVHVYELRRAWNEAEATWWNATRKVLWNTPGANGISKDRTGVAFASSTWNTLGWKPFDFTKSVQKWYANPATNFGTILNSDVQPEFAGRLFRLYSSDYMKDTTKRPNLHIVSW